MVQTYIFIDGSYFCFYRYYSLLTWWKNARPDIPLDNPHSNEEFVAKFRKTFIENVANLKKNLGLKCLPTIYVGKDCPRQEIWRLQHFPDYKSTRGQDDTFMGGPFFKIAYEENLFLQGGAKQVLSCDTLEADDCVALAVRKLLDTNADTDIEIYIITSDRDYLQLASNKVHLYTLAFKDMTTMKSSSGSASCDLFCKIVMGDNSDNIPSIAKKIGPKTALKYYENKELFEKLLLDPEVKKKYDLNKLLVDFNMIPDNLVQKFYSENKW